MTRMPKLILIKHAHSQMTPGVPPEQWRLSEQGRERCSSSASARAGSTIRRPSTAIGSLTVTAIRTGANESRSGKPISTLFDGSVAAPVMNVIPISAFVAWQLEQFSALSDAVASLGVFNTAALDEWVELLSKRRIPTIGGPLTSGQPVFEGGAFDQREDARFFGLTLAD